MYRPEVNWMRAKIIIVKVVTTRITSSATPLPTTAFFYWNMLVIIVSKTTLGNVVLAPLLPISATSTTIKIKSSSAKNRKAQLNFRNLSIELKAASLKVSYFALLVVTVKLSAWYVCFSPSALVCVVYSKCAKNWFSKAVASFWIATWW